MLGSVDPLAWPDDWECMTSVTSESLPAYLARQFPELASEIDRRRRPGSPAGRGWGSPGSPM